MKKERQDLLHALLRLVRSAQEANSVLTRLSAAVDGPPTVWDPAAERFLLKIVPRRRIR
jgi:hypothetical protein